jgi:hypothetical protein
LLECLIAIGQKPERLHGSEQFGKGEHDICKKIWVFDFVGWKECNNAEI